MGLTLDQRLCLAAWLDGMWAVELYGEDDNPFTRCASDDTLWHGGPSDYYATAVRVWFCTS